MQTIENLEDAMRILLKYVPLAKEITGKNITLSRMWPLLERAGNPHEKLKVIHIAGTSGKTSTSYYIAALLRATGSKVGLTVSPHIDSITERVQINSKPLEDSRFCDYLSEFLSLIDGLSPTYFELLIAFAYWVFEKEGVDYAVVETGLGGMHDSTNVAQRSDKICVITDIGFDHMHVLGDKLSQIATQKAGIIHKDNVAFCYEQSSEVTNQFKLRADTKTAQLIILSEKALLVKHKNINDDMPLFQKRNWLLAREVVEYIILRDGFDALSEESENITQQVQVPGRMDILHLGDKQIIMDGAHNQQKMHSFVNSFSKSYPGLKLPILLSVKKGKEYRDVIDELLPITSRLVLTSFSVTQDMQVRSMETSLIAEYCREKGFTAFKEVDDINDAFTDVRNNTEDKVLVTGSFYLISQIREIIKNHKQLPKQG